MTQSHAIDVDGRFVGAAVRQDEGYRFVALDTRLDELDGVIWPTLAEMRWQVRRWAAIERGHARVASAVAARH